MLNYNNIDLNDASLVFRLTYRNTNYLFMADATSIVEKNMLKYDIKSDIKIVNKPRAHLGQLQTQKLQLARKIREQVKEVQAYRKRKTHTDSHLCGIAGGTGTDYKTL